MEFQRQCAKMRKERFENLCLYVGCRSERQRYSDERVLPDGLIFMSLRRYYEGDYDCVRDAIL